MRLLIFGPPGVGKGTQAKRISTEFHIAHVSTGDMLRAAATQGTEMGLKAKAIMDRGQLVPDDVMIGIVRDVLSSPMASNGFLLDGFPRTVRQAEALEEIFGELGLTDCKILELQADDDEIVRRLSGRLVCSQDGSIFNMQTDKVTLATPCPKCGGRLIQRKDDQEETVRERLRVYHAQTAPVIAFYQSRGTVLHVNGIGPVEQVYASIKHQLTEEAKV